MNSATCGSYGGSVAVWAIVEAETTIEQGVDVLKWWNFMRRGIVKF